MGLEHQSGMLAQPVKVDQLPAFLSDAQLGAERGQKSGSIDCIVGHPVSVGINEPFQFARIISRNPARHLILGGSEASVHAVFVLEPVCHHFKLQGADST